MGRSLGLESVVFESDSVQLVKAINSEYLSKELYCVVADVISLASAFVSVSFEWIPRERNSIADSLAKDALNVSGQQVVGVAFN